MMPEVYKKAQPVSRCPQVIMELGAMLIRDFFDGFDFHDYFLIANEVWNIFFPQGPALIFEL